MSFKSGIMITALNLLQYNPSAGCSCEAFSTRVKVSHLKDHHACAVLGVAGEQPFAGSWLRG